MRNHRVRVHRSEEALPREGQLASVMAQVAVDPVDVSHEITVDPRLPASVEARGDAATPRRRDAPLIPTTDGAVGRRVAFAARMK